VELLKKKKVIKMPLAGDVSRWPWPPGNVPCGKNREQYEKHSYN